MGLHKSLICVLTLILKYFYYLLLVIKNSQYNEKRKGHNDITDKMMIFTRNKNSREVIK